MNVGQLIRESYSGYANYLWSEISHPSWGSYFYWLIGVSLFFFLLEVVIPWRKKQRVPRADFWLDAFYMFFNFFLFSLIVYKAASDIVVVYFNEAIRALIAVDLQALNPMNDWPLWAVLLTGFVLRDFIQWWVHRMLHHFPRLWEFHKVHHSVEEMGFAAHLRFHWMENVVYRVCEYVPLALLGIGLYDFFVIHIFTLAWGHYNHANISVNSKVSGGILGLLLGVVFALGLAEVSVFQGTGLAVQLSIIAGGMLIGVFLLSPVMKFVFNSPEMHIWHHADAFPEHSPNGVNFGLTLALWDYLFGKAYVPNNGRDIKLGFDDRVAFPSSFLGQLLHGFGKRH